MTRAEAALVGRLLDAVLDGDFDLIEEIALELGYRAGCERANRCEECGRTFAFPGDLEHHVWFAHSWRAAA